MEGNQRGSLEGKGRLREKGFPRSPRLYPIRFSQAVADAEARLVELDKQSKHLHESSKAQKVKVIEDTATAKEEARDLEERTEQSVRERKVKTTTLCNMHIVNYKCW